MNEQFKEAKNNQRVEEESSKETAFEAASREIKLKGFKFHQQEHDREGRDPKTYHTSEHPRTLEERAKKMAVILNLSPQQQAVVEMAIAWHDTVIAYDPPADPHNFATTIVRHRGARVGDKSGTEGNEGVSARLLEKEMREANVRAGEEIFTEEQIYTAIWAIDATYPDANFGPDFQGVPFEQYPFYAMAIQQNPALGELFVELKEQGIAKGPFFFQPHLEKPLEDGQPVPREVLITALVDLGASGMGEEEEFFKEGDDEMRELFANIRQPETIERLTKGGEEADKLDREKVTAVWIRWLNSQPGFAVWQSLRFEKIIYLLRQQNGITPEEEQGLRKQFSHYPDNIRATRDRAKVLKEKVEEIKSTIGEKEAFLYLARHMHYEV